MSQEAYEFTPLVAVDDGSGNIACRFVDQDNELFEFSQPSVIGRGAAQSISHGGMSRSIWDTDNGNRYTVSLTIQNAINTCDPDYQLSEANRVLVADSLAKAGLGGADIAIGCTLPTEQFYNRNNSHMPINDDRIKAKASNIAKAVSNSFGAYEAPRILAVRVYPEALPAYVYCALNADMTQKDGYPQSHRTLVVDLGEFTNDIALITDGFDVPAFLTRENGVRTMIERFRSMLAGEVGRLGAIDVNSWSITELKSVFARGYIGSNEETERAITARIDVSALATAAADWLSEQLLADMRVVVRDMANLNRIVFVGGGANWLRQQSEHWHHTVEIPNEPQLAIVRGVHILMLNEADDIEVDFLAALNASRQSHTTNEQEAHS